MLRLNQTYFAFSQSYTKINSTLCIKCSDILKKVPFWSALFKCLKDFFGTELVKDCNFHSSKVTCFILFVPPLYWKSGAFILLTYFYCWLGFFLPQAMPTNNAYSNKPVSVVLVYSKKKHSLSRNFLFLSGDNMLYFPVFSQVLHVLKYLYNYQSTSPGP